ncbi:addiction module antidote protein [Candidatus Poriferisodalis sp.]|uniref:addiction module antidote protein n=1 Tax=Candidatus Poriferisodalis sp. TaxID=3101277 RepID=UPI003B01A1E9
MKRTRTRPWDAADHLTSEDDRLAYLNAALETGDVQLISAAMGDIARSRGMAQIAADTGLGRESLYKSLSIEGNPAFTTVLKVCDAMDYQLHAIPAHHDA